MKHIDVVNRIIDEAEYVIEHKSTVRETAKYFCVSKSTIWKNIAIDLEDIDAILFEQANNVIRNNKLERATRGGQATKTKFSIKRKFDQMSYEQLTNLTTEEEIQGFLQYVATYPETVIKKITNADCNYEKISLYKLAMIRNLLNELKICYNLGRETNILKRRSMITELFDYHNKKITGVFDGIPSSLIL